MIGAYRPPGARSGGGRGGGLAERMRLEREGAGVAKKVEGVSSILAKNRAQSGGGAKIPVGYVPDEPAKKSKSAIAKEKKKVKEEADKKRKEEEEAAQKVLEAERLSSPEAQLEEKEKKAKKVRKALKAIEDLKAKEGAGAELNEDQRKKVAGEDELRRQLAALGL